MSIPHSALAPDWISVRYGGWAGYRLGDDAQLLSKSYGRVFVRHLVMTQAGFTEELARATSRLVSQRAIVHVHDFSAKTVEDRRIGPHVFRLSKEDQRILHRATIVLDLHSGETLLWEKMSEAARRKCRRAEADGLAFHADKAPAQTALDRFCELHREMAKRVAIATVDRDLLDRVFAEKSAVLARVAVGSQDVAMNVIYLMTDRGYFLHGVRAPDAPASAAQFCHWRTALELKSSGRRWYDLGGVPTTDPQDGLFQFKASFGGTIVQMGEEFVNTGLFSRLALAGRQVTRTVLRS